LLTTRNLPFAINSGNPEEQSFVGRLCRFMNEWAGPDDVHRGWGIA
jgi:hypothetical protein